MNTLTLIGATAADLISERAKNEDASEGTARFLLDRLTPVQVGSICAELLSRPALAPRCRIMIPRAIGLEVGLPEEILTDERTTYWRNRECDRPILILANTDEDQGQSLRDLSIIGSEELLSDPTPWVTQASKGLSLTPDELRWWLAALRGLKEAKAMPLEIFAEYVLLTRTARQEQGLPITAALGHSLPALHAPRDTSFFSGIPEKLRGQAVRWKLKYHEVLSRRAVYLQKLAPNQQPISDETLLSSLEAVKEQIKEPHRLIINAFIDEDDAGWSPSARALAELEWEGDNIKSFFDGIKARKELPLGKSTRNFYEDDYPETLTEEDLGYLEALDARKTRESNEDDAEFYEQHRTELGRNRALKSKWDKFIFGQPIEASDFVVAILRAAERLFEQAGDNADKKQLLIEAQRGKHWRDWSDINVDAAHYLGTRYKGLKELFGNKVTWSPAKLFDFEALEEEQRKKYEGKYKPSKSTAKPANQIKFTLTLKAKVGKHEQSFSQQIIWTFKPGSILSNYHEDWKRLSENPLPASRVSREPVSAKGKLQSIDLSDVATLMPVYRKDRGSLVPKYEKREDLSELFVKSLQESRKTDRLSQEGNVSLKVAWEDFESSYRLFLVEFQSRGSATETCFKMGDAYAALLDALSKHAPGDKNRKELWEHVSKIGISIVEGGDPASIVTPWHPMRILATAVKDRYVANIIKHLLSADALHFGDARIFFRDTASEIAHAFYPEVCLGYQGDELRLLSLSDTYGDYSLMESPTRWKSATATTNEDPQAAAEVIRALVKRYLELQPHESANMTAVLYNCDTARLPEAVVESLGQLYGEDSNEEVRCHIALRHTNPEKLSRLYEALLEASERDSDSMVASESSRDFMSRLRIGIMADQAPIPSSADGPPADIVFLQDVIARLAEVEWLEEQSTTPCDMLTHVPPRWSRRKPSMRDDLRSLTYLACPVQPEVGWSYLRMLSAILRGKEQPGSHPLPARQISFQNNETKEIFNEVHRLGLWVVNHDEILTRRQLKSLGVRIIRYQQNRYTDRGLIVSSSAPLNVLRVLVQKRLTALGLGLSTEALAALANRMVDSANDISGDIVLRAAKRGFFANELIGLVLSRFLIEDELGRGAVCGWYFLDDYADWLGQKQEHIADILALSPQKNDGKLTLVALLSEAKFVGFENAKKSKSISEVQLRETQARIQDALFGDPGRLDRDLWLARLADLFLDGVDVAHTDNIQLSEWRDKLRNGEVSILLRGYSHVFVHSQDPNSKDPSERDEIGKVDNSWQEVYGRDRVRDLVLAYHNKTSPKEVRRTLSKEEPWTKGAARLPAARVEWGSAAAPRVRASAPPVASAAKPVAPVVASVALAHTANPPAPLVASPDGAFGWASAEVSAVLSGLPGSAGSQGSATQWLSSTVSELRNALMNYGLQAKLVDQRLTPNSALVRFQGTNKLQVSDVESRRTQLLTTDQLRVIRVSAEPGNVVIAVARPDREVVSLVDILRGRSVDQARENQSLVVGVREQDGTTLYLSPGGKHAPHTLIAGTTGSGKSILLQNLLLDIAMTNATAAAKIILIDPKQGVDYFALEDLPHLQGGIIVEQDEARKILEATVQEMDARYKKFRASKVSNLAEYNQSVPASERMPVLWVVHDEFAEWMLTDSYRDAVSSVVQRLSVKARAAGIFMIFAAQRPEHNVMPMQLRDNLGNRLVLRVEGEGTSKIALGEPGAERLLGRGHLAARLQGESDIVIAQVPILETAHVKKIVSAIKQTPA